MSVLSWFLPSRLQPSAASDAPEAIQPTASREEGSSQEKDGASVSSRGVKDTTETEIEEAELISPGQLTLEEGECNGFLGKRTLKDAHSQMLLVAWVVTLVCSVVHCSCT